MLKQLDLICYKQIQITKNKKVFFEKHSTKEGTWGLFELKNGEINFIFVDGQNNEITCCHINNKNPKFLIPPSTLHKLKLVNECPFSATIKFYCKSHRYFHKKYGLAEIHPYVLYIYNNYISGHNKLKVLDVDCGSGRNLLFLALKGHQVAGIDLSEPHLLNIKKIVQEEKMEQVNTVVADLNTSIDFLTDYYNLVISTVTLQFLPETRVEALLNELQAVTAVNGLHLPVFPIQKNLFIFPPSFTFLPLTKKLYQFYQNKNWSILEYKEKVGQLHKVDNLGKPIQGLFGFLLAKKIHHT